MLLNERQNRPRLQGSFQNKWLAAGDDCSTDHESGIGITVASSESEVDISGVESLSLDQQESSISRKDFVSELPAELAIQILSYLDASGLASSSRVSRNWKAAIDNQHIWRESFLREKTGTYATSGPVRPGHGLGVPTVHPTNDWRQIYRVRDELDKKWKAGKARCVYLHGHLDSIYCLQFDEYALPRAGNTVL
jgi:F-box and WD-40 domain protein 1/11